MALTKRTRFILVQSTSNANVTDDNMEPYHISVFRRSTSMPPLPRASKRVTRLPEDPSSTSVRHSRRDKDEVLTNKFYRLNLHTMKKKSARISMRLSSAFGLAVHTIDEQFNFQEQRFRALEKFLKVFLRNLYICVEALREGLLLQVSIAEDFQELLMDKLPDLPQQFVRSRRLLFENTYTEFCSHIEAYIIHPINILLKLFIPPSTLISKRHKKLLDYDSAQSAYEKVRDQQVRQAKQILDLSKQTYDILNNRLLEELPVLYDYSCQIVSICLKEFIRGYFRLIQQMQVNIRMSLNQTNTSLPVEQVSWPQIIQRFNMRTHPITEQFCEQLTVTAKNFSERLRNLPTTPSSLVTSNVYNCDKEIYNQTDDIRNLLKNLYAEKDLFVVIQDYHGSYSNRTTNSRTDVPVRNGDLVGVVNPYDGNNSDTHWFVDNGVTRGYLPRSILTPLLSDDPSPLPPPTPVRHDISAPSQAPIPLARKKLPRNNSPETEPRLINSAHQLTEEKERIYLNQQDCPASHPDDVTFPSNEQERIYIALYDFESAIDGVLCLQVGERLKIIQQRDDDGNDEWWFAEKIENTKQRGYVPANYVRAVQ